MGLFDSLKRAAGNAARQGATNAVNSAANGVGKGKNSSKTAVFAQKLKKL